MTIKELYKKAVEDGYENLPLYDRVYAGYSEANSDIEINAAFIQVENDKVIFI